MCIRGCVEIVLLLSLLGFLRAEKLWGQSDRVHVINAGEVPMAVIPPEVRYRFPQFMHGSVVFYDGKSIPALLNYNLLYKEMQFINQQQDTLSLANEQQLKNIHIGDQLYYYSPRHGYVEIVADFSSVKLARRQGFRLIAEGEEGDHSVIDGYLEAHAGSKEIRQHKRILSTPKTARQFYNDQAKHELTLIRIETFFLIDQNSSLHRARKSSFRKVFSGHRRELYQYIDEHAINFRKEEDLISLLRFCALLQ